ncbi:hypothetical protein FIBSPDRAFT_922576 [Athelia psychrophila]|uniref:Uncharacterized protein n=1 Tax=Athelia psychrophila TaxID=1759441 RepID=A0A165XZL1_9AGAM|nr:hypothetical protein FIBSPDRAFT_922576 [Fibularhizoctonia sp. CBS 109695]
MYAPVMAAARLVGAAAPKAARTRVARAKDCIIEKSSRLFVFIVVLNLIGVLLASIGRFPYAHKYTGALVLGNLLAAILVRNELFLRGLYLAVNTLFHFSRRWAPLRLRLALTSFLLHIGGIHSGCATSGFFWLVYRVTNILLDNPKDRDGPLVAGIIVNLTLAISIASAFPWVRSAHHNVFERHHRFVGWLGLSATWVFVILDDMFNLPEHIWNEMGLPLFKQLLRTQNFYYVIFMTILTFLPWCCVRRVKVDIEVPSTQVIVIRFARGMQQGLVSRISLGPVLEYHPFGTISEGAQADCHYMVCGARGDYTKRLMAHALATASTSGSNAASAASNRTSTSTASTAERTQAQEQSQTQAQTQTRLWTRQLKFPGVSHSTTLYRRGIRLCTGTGIGSALSVCIQNPNWYLLWLGSDQEKNFGPTISGLIHRNIAPERQTIWDSKKEGGRPDTVRLLKSIYAEWGAEVVFITSSGAREILEGCAVEGMNAFGTLEDF